MVKTAEELLTQLEPFINRAKELFYEVCEEQNRALDVVREVHIEKKQVIPQDTFLERIFPLEFGQSNPLHAFKHHYGQLIRYPNVTIENWKKGKISSSEAIAEITENFKKDIPFANQPLSAMLEAIQHESPEQVAGKEEVKMRIEEALEGSIANFTPMRQVLDEITALYPAQNTGAIKRLR